MTDEISSAESTSVAEGVVAQPVKKPWYKKWWVWIIAVALLGAMANGLGGSGSTDTTAATSSASESAASASTAEEAPTQEAAAEPEPAPTAADILDGNFGTFAAESKSGKGDSVIKVPSGATGAIVSATHKGSSNFVIETLDESNQSTGLLVNTIGSYAGSTMFTSDEAPVKLKVTADGSWSVNISPVSTAPKATSANSGKGDAVLVYEGVAADWKMSHAGESNFVVEYMSTSGSDLLVNEIGKYDGVVPASEGPGVFIVNADGKWTMNAE